MHILDKGTEEERATLKGTADVARTKDTSHSVELKADLQQHIFPLCVDSACV
jgi:hypothetical protein